MRSRCSNERGGPYVFAITVLILAMFLLFRLGILLVQKYHDARGAGRSFKRMLKSGALDAQVYEEAVWSEVEHFGKKRLRAKISREQQRIIRAAKTQMRDDFLDDIQPGFYQYIIIFLIASILGLVLEMVWMFVMFGIVESRVGLVWGPFSPLYGFGAVLLIMLLWKLRKKPWWVIFVVSAVTGGLLEQGTGWCMEYFMHAESWSYLHLPDHISQWVAWRFLAIWGCIGIAWCKVIMPELIYRIGEPTTTRQMTVVTLLTVFVAADIAMTLMCFYRAGKRQEGVPPKNPFEVYVDTHYNDEFMADTFENMTFTGPQR